MPRIVNRYPSFLLPEDICKIARLRKYLRLIRYCANWRTVDLAYYLGVSRQTVSNLENCKTPMTYETYMAIRRLIDEEIFKSPAETSMLKCVIEGLIDHKYYKADQNRCEKLATLFSSAVKTKAFTMEEACKEFDALFKPEEVIS